METLISVLPGDFKECLSYLLSIVAKAKAASPILEDQITWAETELQAKVGDKITTVGIAEGVKELFQIAAGVNWGPPNPGAPAIV